MWMAVKLISFPILLLRNPEDAFQTEQAMSS
jgi:hypothetical protein